MNKNHCLYRLHRTGCVPLLCVYTTQHTEATNTLILEGTSSQVSPSPLFSVMKIILGIMKLVKTFKPQCECPGLNDITTDFFSLGQGKQSSHCLTVDLDKELIVTKHSQVITSAPNSPQPPHVPEHSGEPSSSKELDKDILKSKDREEED